MANYAVTDQTTAIGDLSTVAAELETLVEAVDNTKTIRLLEVVKVGNETFQGILIHDA